MTNDMIKELEEKKAAILAEKKTLDEEIRKAREAAEAAIPPEARAASDARKQLNKANNAANRGEFADAAAFATKAAKLYKEADKMFPQVDQAQAS